MIPDHIAEAHAGWEPVDAEDYHATFPDARVTFTPPAVEGQAYPYSWDTRFRPDYSPMRMMRMGIFGDAYWGDELGQRRMALLPQNVPFTYGGQHYANTRGSQAKRVNYYGRPASQTRQWWHDKRLIANLDPLGWFEWYCWYWLGRRVSVYDDWQIGRWLSFKSRHVPMYVTTGYPGNAQALLHWGIRAPDLGP